MQLTHREREILCFMCLPVKEISKRLHISNSTVNTHIDNILKKFNYKKNRFCIIIDAIKQGIINIDEVVTE